MERDQVPEGVARGVIRPPEREQPEGKDPPGKLRSRGAPPREHPRSAGQHVDQACGPRNRRQHQSTLISQNIFINYVKKRNFPTKPSTSYLN